MSEVKVIHFVLMCLSLFIGCKSVEDAKPQMKEWPQKCEMCGSEWLVTPVADPDEVVPPTVEWCFNDGQYCEVGFKMIVDAYKNGQSDELDRQWINHCLTCQGCRCASFDPVEWRKITVAIKRVREDNDQ